MLNKASDQTQIMLFSLTVIKDYDTALISVM